MPYRSNPQEERMLETEKGKLGPLETMVCTLEAARKTLEEVLVQNDAMEEKLIGPGPLRSDEDRRTPAPFEVGVLGELAVEGLKVLHLASEVMSAADRFRRRLEGGRNPETAGNEEKQENRATVGVLNKAQKQASVWEMVTGTGEGRVQE